MKQDTISVQHLKTALSAIQEGISIMDLEKNILYANEAMQQRYPEQPLVGKKCYQIHWNGEKACQPCMAEEAIYFRNTIKQVMELTDHNGEERIISVSVSPVTDEDGNIIGSVEVNRDITEERKQEEEKQKQETKYRHIFEHAPIGLFHFDDQGTIISCNNTVAAILDTTPENVRGRNLLHLANTAITEEVKKVLEGKTTYLETWHTSEDSGKQIFVRGRAVPVFSKNRRVIGGTAIVEDITLQKQYETELRESEARFHNLFKELDHVAVQGYAMDGTVQYWNRGSENLYGYTAKEAMGKNLLDLIIPPEMKEQVRRELQTMAKTHQPILPAELKLQRKDRQKVTVYSNHTMVQIPGKPLELFCVDIDLTEIKKLEQTLREEKKQAQQAVQIKDQFLANMSHELRTPLNGLMGMLQLTEMTELTEEQRDYIESALVSCHSLTDVVGDILNYIGTQNKSRPLEESIFSLEKVIGEVIDLHQVSAFDQNIKMIRRLSDALPEKILGDRYKIKKMINNVVGNAVKFTEEGTVSIGAEIKEEIDAHRLSICIQVQDTGIGIPASQQKKIFDPFYQVDNSNTRRYGGLGLGLSTVRELAEQMKGDISVTSTPEKGSTFTLTFEAGKPKPSCTPKEETIVKENRRENLLILVVDDDYTSQVVAQHYLEKMGHRVRIANNGQEALEAIQKNRYDLILMDCQMPAMDGYETTRKIREKESTAEGRTPIVAMTAKVLSGERTACLQAGMDGFMAKPFDRKNLIEIIDAFVTD